MDVVLKRNCFIDGVRYKANGGKVSVEIPDHVRELLPKDAVILEEPLEALQTRPEPMTLSEAAKAFTPNVEAVEGEELEKATKKAESNKSSSKKGSK